MNRAEICGQDRRGCRRARRSARAWCGDVDSRDSRKRVLRDHHPGSGGSRERAAWQGRGPGPLGWLPVQAGAYRLWPPPATAVALREHLRPLSRPIDQDGLSQLRLAVRPERLPRPARRAPSLPQTAEDPEVHRAGGNAVCMTSRGKRTARVPHPEAVAVGRGEDDRRPRVERGPQASSVHERATYGTHWKLNCWLGPPTPWQLCMISAAPLSWENPWMSRHLPAT